MKVVVDINVLFSFFWEGSFTRKLILNSSFDLITPVKAVEELGKYSKEIIRKIDLTRNGFNAVMKELKKIVSVVDRKEYEVLLKKARGISPDEGDADFFALCLREGCFLWSNDALLKEQDDVRVLSTEDIVELMFG